MSELQDYPSSLKDPASRKFETFSYLPPMSSEQIRRQIEYIVARGWNPGIEHIEPETVGNRRRVLLSELSGRTNIVAQGP